MNEKRKHMNELRQHGQSVRKKSKKHQRQLEQIRESVDEQKEQVGGSCLANIVEPNLWVDRWLKSSKHCRTEPMDR